MLSVPPTFNCAETIRLIGQRCRFDRERLPVSITVKHASIFAKKFSPLFSLSSMDLLNLVRWFSELIIVIRV